MLRMLFDLHATHFPCDAVPGNRHPPGADGGDGVGGGRGAPARERSEPVFLARRRRKFWLVAADFTRSQIPVFTGANSRDRRCGGSDLYSDIPVPFLALARSHQSVLWLLLLLLLLLLLDAPPPRPDHCSVTASAGNGTSTSKPYIVNAWHRAVECCAPRLSNPAVRDSFLQLDTANDRRSASSCGRHSR